FAGVNLNESLLTFSTRDESATLSFTNISPATAGSFDISSGATGESRTVEWSFDQAVLLDRIQKAFYDNSTNPPTGLVVGIDPDATATVVQISPTQYTITFGGTLGKQDLLPN